MSQVTDKGKPLVFSEGEAAKSVNAVARVKVPLNLACMPERMKVCNRLTHGKRHLLLVQ